MTKTCLLTVAAHLALGMLGARGADQSGPGQWEETTLLKGHNKPVSTLAFSPDGKVLGSVDGGGVMKLWDVATGKVKATVGGRGLTILAIRFDAGSQTVSTVSSEGFVTAWNVASGKRRSAVRLGLRDAVITAAFSPDGKTLATTAGNLVEARTLAEVQLWDVATGRRKGRLTGDWMATGQLQFSPDGKRLAGLCERMVLKPGAGLSSTESDLKVWVVSGRKIGEVRKLPE